MKPRRTNSIVGVSLAGNRFCAALLRRAGRRVRVREVLEAPLSLDLPSAAPELAGREIRDLLDGAGIRERLCVVCVPLAWTMPLHVPIPDGLSEDDEASYLAVQAERELLLSPEDVSFCASRGQWPGGGKGAAVVAIHAPRLLQLCDVLRAARLKPAAFTLGVAALARPAERGAEASIVLHARETGVDMGVAAGGGILAVRGIPSQGGAFDGDRAVDAPSVIRQLRLTLGQVHEQTAREVVSVQVSGPDAIVSELVRALQEEATAWPAEAVRPWPGRAPRLITQPGAEAFAARNIDLLTTAADCLAGEPLHFDFPVPTRRPRKAPWRRRGFRAALRLGAAAMLAAAAVAGVLASQRNTLGRLTAEWRAMAPQVAGLEAVRDELRRCRPWSSDVPEALDIARVVAEAFPEEATVWATRLEIRNCATAAILGRATDNKAWLRMQDRLRKAAGVANLRVSHTRDNPGTQEGMSFSVSFDWRPHARRPSLSSARDAGVRAGQRGLAGGESDSR